MDYPNPHPSTSPAHDESRRIIRVGSDPSNDIVVEGPTVQPFHVEFTFVDDGWLIRDLTQTEERDTQTFLARSEDPTERIPITKPHWASSDDTVYLGTYPFPLAQLLSGPVPPETEETHPGQVVTVGTDSSNRIVITAATVSPRHAEFTLFADYCIIRDCGSRMGTFLVDAEDPSRMTPIVAGQLEASYDDVVLLGTYEFRLSRLREIEDIPLVPDKPTRIGRASDNDRSLNDIRVSNYHSQFVRKGEELFIKDLGSTSGTFKNDHRLPPWTPQIVKTTDIKNGRPADTIKIGSYELSIDPESKDMVRVDFVGDIKLDVIDLQYAIAEKEIVRNISFSVRPGELVGIMGPSGHGKSLLLESISARIQPTGGKTFVNNKPLPEYLDQFRSRIGYVPQSEVLPSQLKVKDLLDYAAKLWLPSDLSEEEINKQVGEVLAQLNLDKVKESRIGVLSGGERRRVNIAYELIRAPNLLFLDEPTTGLSPSDAKNVMEILRQLADAGRTVITVIHQPSMEVYKMLDVVGILFKGRFLYYGPYQFSMDYFKPGTTHPEEIFHVLDEYEAQIKAEPKRTEELLEGWEKKFRESREYEQYVAGRINFFEIS